MATKPTTRKQPFVIEPLDWVAPASASAETETTRDETTQAPSPQESQS